MAGATDTTEKGPTGVWGVHKGEREKNLNYQNTQNFLKDYN